MKKILSVKNINMFITLSIFLFVLTTSAFAIFTCTNGKERCCKDGVQSCCDPLPCPDPIHQPCEKYDLSCFRDITPIDDGGKIGPIDDVIDNPKVDCTAGMKEYKYTADDSCDFATSINTCCSNGKWSGWDTACPKSCDQSDKPDTKEACYGGYRSRTVLCRNGNWVEGTWGDCDCSDPEYETFLVAGHNCCQRKDGTGMLCMQDKKEVGYSWESAGYRCYESSCNANSVAGCGKCDATNRGSECLVTINKRTEADACETSMQWDYKHCKAYICR